LACPDGNVTGRSVYAPELTPRRIELLKEMVPGLSRVAALWNVQNAGVKANCVRQKQQRTPSAPDRWDSFAEKKFELNAKSPPRLKKVGYL
jgi:hypothetical protein